MTKILKVPEAALDNNQDCHLPFLSNAPSSSSTQTIIKSIFHIFFCQSLSLCLTITYSDWHASNFKPSKNALLNCFCIVLLQVKMKNVMA